LEDNGLDTTPVPEILLDFEDTISGADLIKKTIPNMMAIKRKRRINGDD
jgi:hypothetical protein